ncbi:MAG: 2-oxo acid dehydrogenase subunit E2, partial [Verrucomicrobiota bacterium]|nr:2-oxo acid dehydrogenase subunit E2 [Verrucomicrobiota bacterium]
MVKEGDSIAKGQTMVELETGKAVAPIPSPAAGQITKILVQEGAKISVGASILSLAGDSPPTAAPPKKASVPQRDTRPKPTPENEEVEEVAEENETESDNSVPPPAAPSLRRLAQDLGINLRKIRGSENGGRIILADLKTYIQRLQKLAAEKLAASSGVSEKPKPTAPTIDFSKFGPIAKRPMTPLRKVIAQRMTENWNAIPHVTQFDEIDITTVVDLRKKYAEAYDKKGARLTLTSFALKAVVAALKKNPLFNTSLDEMAEEIIYKEYFHIGLAVDTESGLMVPVIRDVDKKDLATLAKELNRLAEKARERKISLEEMQGGTFTISN